MMNSLYQTDNMTALCEAAASILGRTSRYKWAGLVKTLPDVKQLVVLISDFVLILYNIILDPRFWTI